MTDVSDFTLGQLFYPWAIVFTVKNKFKDLGSLGTNDLIF